MNKIICDTIQESKWSFSRLKAFEDCKYKWFLKYICDEDECDQFFSSFGKFVHKILEQFNNGLINKNEALSMFLSDFQSEVAGERPAYSIVENYINDALTYFRFMKPFEYNTLGVEKRVEFSVDKYEFVGYIDYLGELGGEIIMVDHKSKTLKPRKPGKKRSSDDELDEMLKQMYLYSTAVFNEYHKFPSYLCFNCYRSDEFIKEPFSMSAYEETQKWAKNLIEEILNTKSFNPCPDYFKCKYLCSYHDSCEYYKDM